MGRWLPLVVAASLCACGGASSAVAPMGGTTNAPGAVTVVWKAGDPQIGQWTPAEMHQCGAPSTNDATFSFSLTRDGANCSRNQANPVTSSGSLVRLDDGATYVWTFDYVDGTSSGAGPGMGNDRDARSLVWQIHGYNESDTPCTSLNFVNGPQNLKGPQRWGLLTCSGLAWTGDYTPGEADSFQIVARISQTSSGLTQLYRNGVLVASVNGANYHNSAGAPWWNFGIYKWRWELFDGGGSNLTRVNATFSNLVLTRQ